MYGRYVKKSRYELTGPDTGFEICEWMERGERQTGSHDGLNKSRLRELQTRQGNGGENKSGGSIRLSGDKNIPTHSGAPVSSLSCLGLVVRYVSDRGRRHIPTHKQRGGEIGGALSWALSGSALGNYQRHMQH